MQFQQTKNLVLVVFVLAATVIFGVGFYPKNADAVAASAMAPCAFSVNLEVGMQGEDIRCLQKYLNENGFKIAESGVGSPGNETGMYGGLTKEAVRRWQTARGITSTGIFGPLSRDEYLKHVASILSSQVATLGGPTVLGASTSYTTPSVTVEPTVSQSEKEQNAREKIIEAKELIEKTENDVDDDDGANVDVNDANNDIEDAKDDLLKALYSFIDESYDRALGKAEDVIESMNDIQDELHGDSSDAEEAINDAQDAVDNAQDEIDEAYHDGDEVDNARDLLDDAKEKLNDAENEFDDENYDEAERLAKQAENLAEDAVDAIGN